MRLALLVWLAAVVSASALDSPPPYLADAAQDRTGCLWAYSRAERGKIFRFDGTRWEERETSLEPSARAMAGKVVTMTDGSVACLWRLDDNTLAVTRHAGMEKPRVLGTCAGSIQGDGSSAIVLAGSGNRLWITDASPRVYCLDEKGLRLAHEILPEELDKPFMAPQGHNAMHAAEDGRGRIWLWSDASAANHVNLRGVLVLADGRAELHDLAAPLKKENGNLLAVARLDDRHMVVSVAGDGIYRVDIESFALERMNEPAPKTFGHVRELFVHNGDTYAVEYGARYQNSLWRWQGTEWTRLIADADPHQNSPSPRCWLPIREGLLMASFGGGPWFIPAHGEPARFSWRSGLPLEDAHSLARLPDGTFFALGPRGQMFHSPLDLPPRERDNPRIAEFDSKKGWTVDADGHPWTVITATPRVLRGWNGEAWEAHPIPAGAEENGRPGVLPPPPPDLRTDAEGRVWVMGDYRYTLHLFDTHSGQWQEFPKQREAYLALRDHPPHFLGDDIYTFGPQYSADRQRVAYREGVVDVHYYDGSSWRQFSRVQIDGNKKSNYGLGPPWFDKDGRLCVNIRPGITWRLGDDGKWSQTPFESHFPTDHWSETAVSPGLAAPEGCVTNQPDSVVLDNRGLYWLTWQNNLYKAMPGRCIKVFADDELSPFHTERRLTTVFVDAGGNAFLGTRTAVAENFILKPKSPPPRTTVTIEPASADAVQAQLRVESKLPTEVRWQLDNSPWQTTKEATLTLRDLPDGAHKLRVSALDAELQTESRPVETAFEIHVDPARQIADLIAGLSDPDYDRRKAAIDALARQPERSVPALQRARETANAEQRWWIDAALQRIDAARSPIPASPEKP